MPSRSSSDSFEGDWSTPGLTSSQSKWSTPTISPGNGLKFGEKEKLGRGRIDVKTFIANMLRRFKPRLAIAAVVLILFIIYSFLPHRLSLHSRFIIVVPTNQGGGVMEWKGAKEWAIERDSIKNKVDYARRWGYDLEIVDMMTKKRYAHEWRESWEKVDVIRKALRKHPKAEWVWWLDLHTFIMEPSYSLESHIFNQLKRNTYRDINHYNPLNISHPLTTPHLTEVERSPVGDNNPNSISLIVPQDCSGFNLGSFFMKRGDWTDRLLDLWWDPVFYEQRHMQWEHKEQDALEYLYTNQPWIRSRTAFISQRKINSFPPGACSDNGMSPRIHYDQHDRDFVVNMAGCQWGRDCWDEMMSYRELSRHLNRGRWQSLKDRITGTKTAPTHPLPQPPKPRQPNEPVLEPTPEEAELEHWKQIQHKEEQQQQLAQAAIEHGIRPS